MRKVRTLDSVDLGHVRPDGKHASLSGAYGVSGNTKLSYFSTQIPYWHYASLYSATKNPSTIYYIQGKEMFESTTRKKPAFNDCTHVLKRAVNYPFTTGYIFGSRLAGYRGYRFFVTSVTDVTASKPDWSLVSTNMQAEAYHTMIPRFEGDISMLNFILEMKDFRELSAAAFKRIPRIKEQYGIYGSLSAATKRMAEAHLIKSFVVDPTVKDLRGIIAQAQNLVMDAQEKFKEDGLSPESRHFSKTLSQSQNLWGAGIVGTTQYFNIQEGTKHSMKWTSTMEGDYGYKCRSNLDAFTKYWGLSPTAEAVWNALPFSFLVDYFFSIGHALNVMRHDKNVSYNVRQYCESITSTSQSGLFLTDGRTNCQLCWMIDDNLMLYGDRPSSSHFAGLHSSFYERVVKRPYWGPFLPRWKVPSDKQSLNAAALLRCLL